VIARASPTKAAGFITILASISTDRSERVVDTCHQITSLTWNKRVLCGYCYVLVHSGFKVCVACGLYFCSVAECYRYLREEALLILPMVQINRPSSRSALGGWNCVPEAVTSSKVCGKPAGPQKTRLPADDACKCRLKAGLVC
jgi:hypothetical protein